MSNEKKFYMSYHNISLDTKYMNKSNYSIITIKKKRRRLYYEMQKILKKTNLIRVKSLIIIKHIKFLWKIRTRYYKFLVYNYRNKKSK